MVMQPHEFKWAVFVLRRRAQDGDRTLWRIVDDAEALIEGRPTTLPREQIVAEVEREVRM